MRYATGEAWMKDLKICRAPLTLTEAEAAISSSKIPSL